MAGDRSTFCQSPPVQFWRVCAHNVVSCCYNPCPFIFCAFQDAILLTTAIKSSYMSVHGLPLGLSQCGRSTLTPFPPTELPLAGCFLAFEQFWVNSRDCRAWKNQRFLNPSKRPAWHQPPCRKVTSITTSPYLDADVNIDGSS